MEPSSSKVYKIKCCVPGCNDTTSKRHRFPKDVDLCNSWVQNIGCPKLSTLSTAELYNKFVCDIHFEEYYRVPGTKRGLRKDAIPSLQLSNVQSSTSGTSPATREEVFTPPNLPTKSSDGRKRHGILQAVGARRAKDLTPRCKKFYALVGKWARQTAVKQHRIRNLTNRLREAEKVEKNYGQCEECVKMLTHSDGDIPMAVIEARQYRLSTFTKPGSYLYFVTSECVSRLLFYIPRICYKQFISVLLRELLNSELDFNVLNCNIHPTLGNSVVEFQIRVMLFYWAKQINLILKGNRNEFLKNKTSRATDPIKVHAHNMYLKRKKRNI
ncbi:uncharacterized protein LOC107398865 isoform X2 [Tribolium castaneum]|uniref:uncharacterized protein LOC107398865 isoform X2 n=1 Tax=Tribolium castaneum TaxID=7070 RepID=UPI0030FE801D